MTAAVAAGLAAAAEPAVLAGFFLPAAQQVS